MKTFLMDLHIRATSLHKEKGFTVRKIFLTLSQNPARDSTVFPTTNESKYGTRTKKMFTFPKEI